MKTKNPKCIKCNKPMKVIYTKSSYKLNDKVKTFWSKEGYICNHIYYPFVKLTKYKQYVKDSYLISIYDTEVRDLLKALKKIFSFYSLFS